VVYLILFTTIRLVSKMMAALKISLISHFKKTDTSLLIHTALSPYELRCTGIPNIYKTILGTSSLHSLNLEVI
jgi:hypothetical protein